MDESPALTLNCATCGWMVDRNMFERSEKNGTTLLLNSWPSFAERDPHKGLLISAGAGCYCCRVLLDCVQKLEITFQAKCVALHWAIGDALSKGQEPPGALFDMKSGGKKETIQVFTVPADGSAPCGQLRNRIASGNTASQSALNRAMGWISHCVAKHRRCTQGDSLKLPTRVLDISPFESSEDVVLRQTAEQNLQGHYAALSHCWGDIVPACRTTRANLQDQQSRIRWMLLPKTFQDAVIFTRRLGIRYLWIDTMCIVQDDVADWQHEAVQMCDVYGNAFVTLAAVHSPNCEGGLFSEADPMFEQYEVSSYHIDGLSCKVYARRPFPTFHTWSLDRCGRSAVLFTRAWAYQERLVSPRVLYFTEHELLWECFEDAGCECVSEMTEPWEGSDYDESRFWCPKLYYAVSFEMQDLGPEWHRVVEQYSKLALSVKTDRLPAIGGVAKQFAKHRVDEKYLAGCWSETFLLDLLWHAGLPQAPPPCSWCAPSWSWASTTGRVCYFNLFYPEYKFFVEVVDIICDYTGGDPYGQLSSGKITVKGKLESCTLEPYSPGLFSEFVLRPRGIARTSEGFFKPWKYKFSTDTQMALSSGTGNLDDHLRIHSEVFVLKTAESKISDDDVCHLILQRIRPGCEDYRRVGIFNSSVSDCENWFANEAQIISIE